MNIERMKELKLEHGLSYEMIAEKTGVPISTIQKIFSGISRAPRRKNMMALQVYFDALDDNVHREDSSLRETEFLYAAGGRRARGIPQKTQGTYTLDDYSKIPDEYRVELIDGTIYDMASPDTIHQMIASMIQIRLADYIKMNNGKCVPYSAPLDVQLWPTTEDGDLHEDDDHGESDGLRPTVIQPDLMVLCPGGKASLRVNRIYGPPDLVMEIVSPSSAMRDTVLKLDIYKKAGVREYWIIDPINRRVLVYDFSSEVPVTIYGFRDKVPVRLYGGDLSIDFAEIDDYVKETFMHFGNSEMR